MTLFEVQTKIAQILITNNDERYSIVPRDNYHIDIYKRSALGNFVPNLKIIIREFPFSDDDFYVIFEDMPARDNPNFYYEPIILTVRNNELVLA